MGSKREGWECNMHTVAREGHTEGERGKEGRSERKEGRRFFCPL